MSQSLQKLSKLEQDWLKCRVKGDVRFVLINEKFASGTEKGATENVDSIHLRELADSFIDNTKQCTSVKLHTSTYSPLVL
jgi:hypothetical protein